ncbi:RNA 3'-terminal phosphate cyclase domain-containing protein [Ampelomyces quisqualis]|uniref:RNA 3'-terminal phosphate cyclase domain-containing protein n=1 Tax=Ampelomyces quisqualis TaxID=50730 RepID=A0A6A5QM98_AMPQU|nr:RNA 3'-terminal phosphate cyclase domain-containing protein [Ampelomyces quisqualis]
MAPKSTPRAVIHLEGTTLEGGGQLVRIALGLSSLTKKPINITNIRGKRSGGGGLKAQHLTSVQWLGQACNAGLSGVGLKSKEITFTPKQDEQGKTFNVEEQGGQVRITQSTPGSINLIFQAILPYILFSGTASPICVRIVGGTNVSNSPSYEYIHEVLVPMLALIGVPPIEAEVHSRGWSQGSTSLGNITYTIQPLQTKLPAFQLEQRGSITHVKAIIIAPRDMEQSFRGELDVMFEKRESRFFGANTTAGDFDITFEDSHHEKRYYLLLVATTSTGIKLGRDWLYNQAIRPGKTERIVPTMVKKVLDDILAEIEHGGCVDEYMRDQLVIFQALADGKSHVSSGRRGDELVHPSLHAKTAMWVAKEIIGVNFDEEGGCKGVGFRPGGQAKEEEKEADLEDLASDLKVLDVSSS